MSRSEVVVIPLGAIANGANTWTVKIDMPFIPDGFIVRQTIGGAGATPALLWSSLTNKFLTSLSAGVSNPQSYHMLQSKQSINSYYTFTLYDTAGEVITGANAETYVLILEFVKEK